MPCSCASVHMTAGSTEPPRCVWSSASPPRAISATIAFASGSASNGLCEPGSRDPVRDGLEALDRLGAEDEAHVALRHLVAPAAHAGGGDLRVVEEDLRGLLGL